MAGALLEGGFMKTRRNVLCALGLAGAVGAAGCSQKETAGSRPESGPTLAAGTAAPLPAPWEAIDNGFKGCEGG